MSRPEPPASPTASERLDMLQVLRAVAAIMVVVLHAQAEWAFPFFSLSPAKLGAGVDLFFVISGFVIVYASRPYFATPGGWHEFLVRRLIRIVPLYWMALSMRVVLLAGAALVGVRAFPSAEAVLTSYLFIPYDSLGFGDQYPFPILDLGWTLNYEMFFYLVFAAFIFLPMRLAVAASSLALLAGVLAASVWSFPLPVDFWLRPIVLEFVAGMLIALAFIRGIRVPPVAGIGLVFLSLAVWTFIDLRQFGSYGGPGFYSFPRFFVLGGGAILLMAAAVLTRGVSVPRVLGPLVPLGDSSYALYLLHPFVFLLFKGLFRLWQPPEALADYAFLPVVLCTVVAAHAFHLLVEKPVTLALRRRILRPKRIAGALGG